MGFPPSEIRCSCSRWRHCSFSRPASWARRRAPGSNDRRRRPSSSWPPACLSSSSPAFRGRVRRSRPRCWRRAPSFRRISRSTASCASASWGRAFGRWRTTGAASGLWRSVISSWPRSLRISLHGGGMASPNHSMIARALIVLLVLVAAAAGGYFLLRPQPTMPIVGVVRSTEIRVAPEVGGQLAAIKVRKGSNVKAGEIVAELSALELTAAVAQARAALAAATASRNNVYAGVRAEQIAALAAEIGKAKSRVDYAQAQPDRPAHPARHDHAPQPTPDPTGHHLAAGAADNR